LAQTGHDAEIVIIKTTGDKILHLPLARIGGKGLFTKEIEEALLDGRVDLAVHSLKDLPTTLPQGLTIAAMPQREDPRDVLVGATLDALPDGAVVGTGSLRRAAQLRALRPGLVITDIRGNVDTRLRKHKDGLYHALVMASAGLTRLGLQHEIAEYLDPLHFLPAVAQGALAIETRHDDGAAWQAARSLHDPQAAATVDAERALLAALGGGCQVPLGAFASIHQDALILHAAVAASDGSRVVRMQHQGNPSNAVVIGQELAALLLQSEAGALIAAAHDTSAHDTSAHDTPAHDTPAHDTPTRDVPTQDIAS
jgi:hydroxymethylbilane synthase